MHERQGISQTMYGLLDSHTHLAFEQKESRQSIVETENEKLADNAMLHTLFPRGPQFSSNVLFYSVASDECLVK